MAEKSVSIVDIKSSDKVAPNTSGRPILVTNRPVLANDPMMVAETTDAEKPKATESSMHSKTIKPISAESDPDEAVNTPSDDAAPARPDIEPIATNEPASEVKQTDEESEPEDDADTPTHQETVAEADAAATEAAEAAAARATELEEMVASGKYAVPINAVGRKRSHLNVLMLCLLAVVLAVVLVDVLLDMGVIKISAIPHTHLFKTTN